MKVALIIEWIDAWRGGAETSTAQFVRHLLDQGIELTVFTRSRPSPTPHLRVETIACGLPGRAQRALRFAERAAAAVRAEPFDVVHAISPCLAADVYEPRGGTTAESVRRNLELRPPGWARGLKRAANRFNLKQRLLLRIERKLLGGTRQPMVIALSDYVVRQLREHYDYPATRIRKVFNGVDVPPPDAATRLRDRAEIRGLYHIRDSDCLAIMVAHNFKLKGLRRWISALKLIAEGTDVPVRSLVIGKDSAVQWERLVAREGLSGRLQIVGATRRIEAFYHAAELLVHPTHYDPCSRVVLEAMAAGLPVVTTHYDGASEVIEHGVNGFVVDEADVVGGLVDCVVRLADAALRQRIGAAAAGIADRLSMQRHADGVCQVYREVVESR